MLEKKEFFIRFGIAQDYFNSSASAGPYADEAFHAIECFPELLLALERARELSGLDDPQINDAIANAMNFE